MATAATKKKFSEFDVHEGQIDISNDYLVGYTSSDDNFQIDFIKIKDFVTKDIEQLSVTENQGASGLVYTFNLEKAGETYTVPSIDYVVAIEDKLKENFENVTEIVDEYAHVFIFGLPSKTFESFGFKKVTLRNSDAFTKGDNREIILDSLLQNIPDNNGNYEIVITCDKNTCSTGSLAIKDSTKFYATEAGPEKIISVSPESFTIKIKAADSKFYIS